MVQATLAGHCLDDEGWQAMAVVFRLFGTDPQWFGVPRLAHSAHLVTPQEWWTASRAQALGLHPDMRSRVR